jgi:hypothetical protein
VAACAGDRRDNQVANDAASAPETKSASRDQVSVTGCLTANAQTNQYVLTANSTALTSLTNRAGAGEAETFHYQLVGGTDLPSYIGKEVVVTGSVEGDGKDVNMKEKDKSTEPPTTTPRGDTVTPAIETKQEIEIQVERLNVATIKPTGAACQMGARP